MTFPWLFRFFNSMIFPCMELFLVIFQVLNDFQSLWEPWLILYEYSVFLDTIWASCKKKQIKHPSCPFIISPNTCSTMDAVTLTCKTWITPQRVFCLSLGAEFRPHSQSKIATFFSIPCLFFPIKKRKKNSFFYFFFRDHYYLWETMTNIRLILKQVLCLKGTATLMITIIYMKALNKPWILIPVLSKSWYQFYLNRSKNVEVVCVWIFENGQ